jgi:membrane protein
VISVGFTRLPLTWRDLVTRTVTEFVADNGLGLAAQLAYYYFFSLFPAILVAIALAGFFPLEDFLDRIVSTLGGVVPTDVITIVQEQIRKISQGDKGGVLTFGLVAALWSSSAAMVGLIAALNRAYDVQESRPWWKVRLLALVLTLALAVFILVAFALVLLGPSVADHVARVTGLGPVFSWTWKVLQWPVVCALVALGTGIVYYFAPDAEQEWVWVTPGSVLTTVLWLVASLGFKYYVSSFGAYTETYGAIGGVMVLLLWFYLSGLVTLLGAELNAEIAHAAPPGQGAGEKGPGPAERHRRSRRRAPVGAPAGTVRGGPTGRVPPRDGPGLRTLLRRGALALVPLLWTTALDAAPVRVRFPEGTTRGFLAIRNARGELIGHGELRQKPRGDEIDSRLLLQFRNGSVHDEATTYSQQGTFRLESYRLTQRGPSFPGAEISFDRRSGRYRARTRARAEGPEDSASGELAMPADLYNGMALLVLKNMLPGEQATGQLAVFTPKPRLLRMDLRQEGEDRVVFAGAPKQATRHLVNLEIGGITGVVAAVIGKSPPDLRYWLVLGEIPAFVRFEGSMFLNGPVWRVEMAGVERP